MKRPCPKCGRLRSLWRCETPGEWKGVKVCVSCGDALGIAFRYLRSAELKAVQAEMSLEERKAAAQQDIKDLCG